MSEDQQATTRTWRPACPSCDRTTRGTEAQAESRRDAVSDLRGRQVTCSACGETFTVDRRTLVRQG